jgi:hypothetical protein
MRCKTSQISGFADATWGPIYVTNPQQFLSVPETARTQSETAIVLNKFGPSGQGEAQVQYLDGDFRVISPGSYVRCAVTDVRIPLDELKYWSVDLQEAYAMPNAVLQRHFPGALKAQV